MNRFFPFGRDPQGRPATLYTLKADGIEADFTDYGATLVSLRVPDRSGTLRDVVLGYRDVGGYARNEGYLGAAVGRFANRIKDASFTLNGTTFRLTRNENGKNHLHGGRNGFDKRFWRGRFPEDGGMEFTLETRAREDGWPGRLEARILYRPEDGGLTILYEAVCDHDTPISLTNHSYFALSGGEEPGVRDELRIFADAVLAVDEELIPAGELPVEGTPFDFRAFKPIERDLHADHPQLKIAGGFDHNFILRDFDGLLRPAAQCFNRKSGIVMEVLTDRPGLQFYSGNALRTDSGKQGPYGPGDGYCLETQAFPDSPHHPEYPSCLLKRGEVFRSVTRYAFGVREE